MTPWLSDPEHWWFRAEEARTVAEQMANEHAREMMLSVAETYVRLAKMAENTERPKIEAQQRDITIAQIARGWRRRI